MRFIVPKILALAVSVRAAGIAVVLNNSPGPIYVWSVGGSVGPRHDIKAGQYQGGRWFQFQLTVTGGIYWEEMRRDDRSGGIAIKITRAADGLLSGAPQQVWAYNVDGATVWYDLSTVWMSLETTEVALCGRVECIQEAVSSPRLRAKETSSSPLILLLESRRTAWR
jgi:Na+/proline symporter